MRTQFNARVPERTRRMITELANEAGCSQSDIMIAAIERMHATTGRGGLGAIWWLKHELSTAIERRLDALLDAYEDASDVGIETGASYEFVELTKAEAAVAAIELPDSRDIRAVDHGDAY